jgi:hypothetical protein
MVSERGLAIERSYAMPEGHGVINEVAWVVGFLKGIDPIGPKQSPFRDVVVEYGPPSGTFAG